MESTTTDTQATTVDTAVTTPVAATTTVTEPTPIELDDNALIRVKGSEKPVKFGEHVRGFQSQFTKATQRAAQLQRELQARDAKLQELQREREQAQRTSQRQGETDVYAQLRELPYLDGQTAVSVVQGIAQQIQQRDQVLLAAMNQIKQMKTVVDRLNQTHTTGQFDGKIDRWLNENGWPTDLRDLAKEVYLAYEGDDLDEEFPRIFNGRVEQMRKAFNAERESKLRASKPQPFLPGRGGNTSPSKPLEFKGDASAKEIADKLWEQFQVSDT
jgi:hypothetical protein